MREPARRTQPSGDQHDEAHRCVRKHGERPSVASLPPLLALFLDVFLERGLGRGLGGLRVCLQRRLLNDRHLRLVGSGGRRGGGGCVRRRRRRREYNVHDCDQPVKQFFTRVSLSCRGLRRTRHSLLPNAPDALIWAAGSGLLAAGACRWIACGCAADPSLSSLLSAPCSTGRQVCLPECLCFVTVLLPRRTLSYLYLRSLALTLARSRVRAHSRSLFLPSLSPTCPYLGCSRLDLDTVAGEGVSTNNSCM